MEILMAKRRRGYKNIKRGGIDMTLFIVLMIMLSFGLIMVFSASSPSAYYEQNDQYYYIKKQLMWSAVGFVAMLFTSKINYNIVKKYAVKFAVISLIMMFLVPFVGIERNGAKRWLGVGSFTIQPSEIAKFALVFLFAKIISEKPKGHMNNFVKGLCPYLGVLGLFILAMILQDHLSAAVVTFASLIVLLVAGGARLPHIFTMGTIGVGALVPFAILEEYRFKRVIAFIDPFKYIKDIGWQICQGLYAIGSGGLFGRGLGQSRQKFLYVPEAHNDYIYAILCEELGFVGSLILAGLFVALITRCIIIATKAPDMFSSLMVFGITTIIAFQYIINLGVVTAVMPSTGMQLPFFSAGGSSLVFIMAAMGLVFNVSRYVKKEDGYSVDPVLRSEKA